MITRLKTSIRLTMAALSLAVALALPTGPASAQYFIHEPLAEEEIISGISDWHFDVNLITCFPLFWFLYCWTR